MLPIHVNVQCNSDLHEKLPELHLYAVVSDIHRILYLDGKGLYLDKKFKYKNAKRSLQVCAYMFNTGLNVPIKCTCM